MSDNEALLGADTSERKAGANQKMVRDSQDRAIQLFLGGGLFFLFAGLGLFLLTGYLVYQMAEKGILIYVSADDISKDAKELTQVAKYNYYGKIIEVALSPGISLLAALICAFLGMRLLGSTGAISVPTIAPQDYRILAPAISEANDNAVTQFIRISSLKGFTGMFTKLGLSGLPLATIGLTIVLSLLGIFDDRLMELAKLTLGAFLGSFVQRQVQAAEPPRP